jgi:ABC-2 type transport system ATP-binding protein
MSTGAPVLSVINLRKVFQGKTPFVAVSDISFDLHEGEILGLLGPNGAGKTTTIQMLLSTLSPTDGSIIYFGKDFSHHRSEVLSQIAFASTYVSLPYNLTVEQNLNVFGGLYGLSKNELIRRRDHLLERFGIMSKLKSAVSTLSAGQTTRLVLVKSFMTKPKIALLDEPTASLDPDIASDIISFVLEQREKEGISILFTSHNMAEVAKVSDRILFLQNGKIVANDTPEILAQSVSRSKVELVLGENMDLAIAVLRSQEMDFTVDHRTIKLELDESNIARCLSALAKHEVIYSAIRIEQPTLEDYFLKMVKK